MAERKISPYVVSAMCGCWARESGMNRGIWESLTPVPWTAVWSEYGDNTGDLVLVNGLIRMEIIKGDYISCING